MITVNQLKQLGLSDKEARVYLTMLELGPATVLEISTKANVNRPTTYVEIETLKKKGLVSVQMRGRKKIFFAETPEQLRFFLDRAVKAAEQKKEELLSILPDLMTLFSSGSEKPQMRFFEGKEGLMRMQDAFLKVKEKHILAISSTDDVLNVFPDHPQSYASRRVKRGIHAKLIYTTQKGPFLKNLDTEMLRESKFISPDKLPSHIDMTIYDDNVAIAALRGKVAGVIITHKEIADSFRGIFNLIWIFADKL